jgi:hypothetical protein
MRRARVKMMPKNVNRVRGRDGVNRYYYRPRNGRPDIRLPNITDPGFAAAHAAAETMCASTPLVIGESRTIPGSVGAAIAEYLSPSAFVTNRRNGKRKSETTTGKERWILDSFRDRIGSAIGRSSVCNNSMCKRSSTRCARCRRRRAIS